MTKVTVFRDAQGNPCGFTAAGHASRRSSGKGDIYCAAVSAITQTACVGLDAFVKNGVRVTMQDGFLECRLTRQLTAEEKEAVRTILETMILGLQSFSEGNPGHVEMIEEV